MEDKEWCIRQGLRGVTVYPEEDASEGQRIAQQYI